MFYIQDTTGMLYINLMLSILYYKERNDII